MEKNLGTSNKTSNAILMPLTGSKTAFSHQMAVGMERVNGIMENFIPRFGWKLIVHTQSLDRAL
jgi:hypothetical protein